MQTLCGECLHCTVVFMQGDIVPGSCCRCDHTDVCSCVRAAVCTQPLLATVLHLSTKCTHNPCRLCVLSACSILWCSCRETLFQEAAVIGITLICACLSVLKFECCYCIQQSYTSASFVPKALQTACADCLQCMVMFVQPDTV